MDQNTYNLFDIIASVIVTVIAIGGVIAAVIKAISKVRSRRCSLSLTMKPVSLETQQGSGHIGEFDLGKNKTPYAPIGLEMLEVSVTNVSERVASVDDLGISVTYSGKVKGQRSKDPSEFTLQSTAESREVWDVYSGKPFKLDPGETKRFVFNIWPVFDGWTGNERVKDRFKIQAMAHHATKVFLSPMSQSYTLDKHERDFFLPQRPTSLKKFLLQYLAVYSTTPIVVSELSTIVDEIIDKLKLSPLTELKQSKLGQDTKVVEIRDFSEILSLHVKDIALRHKKILNLSEQELGSVIVLFIESKLTSKDGVHFDLLNLKALEMKAYLKEIGMPYESVLFV